MTKQKQQKSEIRKKGAIGNRLQEGKVSYGRNT